MLGVEADKLGTRGHVHSCILARESARACYVLLNCCFISRIGLGKARRGFLEPAAASPKGAKRERDREKRGEKQGEKNGEIEKKTPHCAVGHSSPSLLPLNLTLLCNENLVADGAP